MHSLAKQCAMVANATLPVQNMSAEIHPSLRTRIARGLRFGRSIRGWGRLTRLIAGAPANPAYIISNPTGWFAGSLDSVLESQVYFLGGYEEDLIGAFLGLFTDQNKRAIIDVGANIGTHSIAFARHFNRVVCFEPNENVFPKLQRNISNNQLSNVIACNYGLGDVSDNMSFYSIDNGNEGLGTFLNVEQYDRDLQKIGEFRIERGDDVLTDIIDGPIDAIKLDIQGFEPQALIGLRKTLEAHRPITWVELGNGTQSSINAQDGIVSLFPYPVDIFCFETVRGLLTSKTQLRKLEHIENYVGDVVICPKA